MPSPDDDLLELARATAERAYSPYSKVRVGAALRGADGRTFAGCNVENASYGLTICAERAAVLRAVAEGCTRFERLAIWTSLDHALPPCGACRQVLAEFGLELPIAVASAGGGAGAARLEATLAELLPHAMGPRDLA
jgi:cytidine deaminase